MSYVLKVIVKKSKPLLWYELEVPSGITFSALAVFLDIVSGTKDAPPSDYVFELPSFEVQLREDIFESVLNPLYRQNLREADTTFIDEYMKKDVWFTYKPDKNADIAFRIEVKGNSGRKQMFPFHSRYSRGAWELFEKNNESAFKDKLNELMHFRVRYDEGFHFVKKKEMLDEYGKGRGPFGTMPADFDFYVEVPAMESPKSRSDNTIRSFTDTVREESERVLESIGLKDFRSADRKSLREVLFSIYPETELRRLAEQIGISADIPREILALFKTKERGKVASLILAKRCADRMLEKKYMEERILALNDCQIETLRRAIGDGGIFKAKSFSELDDMAALCELDYAASTKNDDEFLIPTDVMETYKRIDTPDYHHKRRQHIWLLDCLDVVEYFYGSIPIRQFYRLYRQFGELGQDEMVKAIQSLDDFDNPCVVHDGRIIFCGWLHDDEYKALERYQGDKPYCIPAKETVEDISRNGYPSRQREVKTLLNFLRKEMQLEELDAEDLTEEIWHKLNQGETLHDVMDLINERDLVFPSDKAMQAFAECITRLNNTTPMLYNRGFAPEALRPRLAERIRRNGLTVVPGSTQAAGMLAEAADQLRAMGVRLDLDSNAREVGTAFISSDRKKVITGKKKIYPNDSCPCGSGKKYKNCCGKG